MARDLIAIMLDTDPESIEITVVWPADIAEPLAQWHALARQADELRAAATDHQRHVAATLRNHGEPIRDIAAIMGISYRRVQQLTH